VIARVVLASAVMSGLFVVVAPTASASCYPEKPSTCEPVTPHCHVTPGVSLSTLEVDPDIYCHNFDIVPIEP
jgi:hypothetical protein